MRHILKAFLLIFLSSVVMEASAQTSTWRDIYKAKKKDTIYGIARKFEISMEELIEANPEMKDPDYRLKRGTKVFIPFAKKEVEEKPKDISLLKTKPMQTIRIGVMLPLHNVDGDGKRMVEYYRGLLVGCDSLRKEGINTDIHAWNIDINTDIRTNLLQSGVANLDIIFGPLYTKQVKPLADFCKSNDIKLVIPFSTSATDVLTNDHVYEVYQDGIQLNERALAAFHERFPDCNPIFIECNDTSSNKLTFIFNLRKQLEGQGTKCKIRNINVSADKFFSAFKAGKKNVIILDTSRSSDLNLVFKKLNEVRAAAPGFEISMFGYTEWLQYESIYRKLYHEFDAYIPSTFYYYKGLTRVAEFEKNYNKWFGVPTQEQYIPRFAITGFDHAQFFIRGLYEKGSNFHGKSKESTYKPMQTPLKFVRAAENGGLQNTAFQLVHYKRDGVIESVGY